MSESVVVFKPFPLGVEVQKIYNIYAFLMYFLCTSYVCVYMDMPTCILFLSQIAAGGTPGMWDVCLHRAMTTL